MKLGSRFTHVSVHHPGAVVWLTVGLTALVALLAALPTVVPMLWPAAKDGPLSALHTIEVDTDPENMLSADEPVRVFHNEMKQRFSLHDMVVVGVVNEDEPGGVFNPATLARIHELTEYARQLVGGTPEGEEAGLKEGEGVIAADVIAPSTVDNMVPMGENTLTFEWLMAQPPETSEEAREILANAQRIPFFRGTMVPPAEGDGSAVCLYLPISHKDVSHSIYKALNAKIATFDGPEKYYITGLPVAEDTFGVEMFIQMAISAPAAMAIIFLLMLVFFRKLVLILSPMIVALVSVILTMGSLIIAGFPIHIMSSMIPIFIMPIAVLDSIHIISEFFEKYQATRDRGKTIASVMDALFAPMLYTSLTSAAGFASLALTPIPPVQVFGIFVAGGIMAAWLLTVTFIPAFVMFIPPRTLENFGATHSEGGEHEGKGVLARFLKGAGGWTFRYAKPILVVSGIVLIVAGYGISRIKVNDNPIKWFEPSHPIREADRVLNARFGGTYMAYLAMDYQPAPYEANAFVQSLRDRADMQSRLVRDYAEAVNNAAPKLAGEAENIDAFFETLIAEARPDPVGAGDAALSAWGAIEGLLGRLWDEAIFADEPIAPADAPDMVQARSADFLAAHDVLTGALVAEAPKLAGDAETMDQAVAALEKVLLEAMAGLQPGPAADAAGEALGTMLAEMAQADEVFKRPEVLAWLKRVGASLGETGIVGKTNSLVEIVETVNRDLHGGDPAFMRVPSSSKAVGTTITQYQSSHRPQDLSHFVTTHDYHSASMWVQLRSGDNRDMEAVAAHLERFLADNPPPVELETNWFGLTYINVVWQEKMVTGMLEAFAGSFLVVFLLMTLLFGSALWGLLCMIPLTVTIASIYGAIGIVGKDYDMPVAVLSSLTLGLAVDFAIHFLARSRSMYAEGGSWKATAPAVFGEPARAIARNIIVIATGFLPLLLAPLVPYQTVGTLLATILLASGLATLLVLPALIAVLETPLFVPTRRGEIGCKCFTCIASAIALAALVVINGYRYLDMGLNLLAPIAAGVIILMAVGCRLASRRERCRLPARTEEEQHENAEN